MGEQSLQKHQAHESKVNQELTVAKSTITRLEKELNVMKEQNASLFGNIEIYDDKYEGLAKELEDSHRKIFELEAMNELAQRENEELKRDMDKKIRQLEEQLSTSERVIG